MFEQVIRLLRQRYRTGELCSLVNLQTDIARILAATDEAFPTVRSDVVAQLDNMMRANEIQSVGASVGFGADPSVGTVYIRIGLWWNSQPQGRIDPTTNKWCW